MAKKQKKETANAVAAAAPVMETTSQLADQIYSESLRYLRDEIRKIKSGKADTGEHDPASRVAWLAAQASKVASEQRKAEAAEAKRIGSLRYEDVMAYVRQLPRDRRAHFLREAVAIDAERSVLG
jgi:hypothetical protein